MQRSTQQIHTYILKQGQNSHLIAVVIIVFVLQLW